MRFDIGEEKIEEKKEKLRERIKQKEKEIVPVNKETGALLKIFYGEPVPYEIPFLLKVSSQ
jgi:hypothetical protein